MKPIACLVLLLAAAGAPAEVLQLNGAELLKGQAPGVTIAKVAPAVEVHVMLDLPNDQPKTLWSSWGDGCVASDGKYYTGIGNHLDYDAGVGQSRVYAYDPAARSLKMVVDVRKTLNDNRYAAGKIHARIDEGKEGWIYFATYYGKSPEKASPQVQAAFIGSALLRYNPKDGETQMLGPVVEKQGVPTSITDGQRMLMFGYAAYSGDFIVYDLAKRALKFRGGGEEQQGSRNIMLDREGRAYFGRKDGFLARYDAATNRLSVTKAKLPGDGEKNSLRASTAAGRDGTIYGVTHGGTLFAFDPAKESIRELGENWAGGQYTAVMALSSDDRFVYYAPGAHGSGARIGTPVVQLDVKSGAKKVLAFLNPPLREKMKYNIGGTYNLKLSADDSRLLITFNGAMLDAAKKKEETFGLPSIAIIDIPKEER